MIQSELEELMVKYQITVKKFICKKCSHVVVFHTDMSVEKPGVCSVCKGKDFQEKRSTA